MSMTVAHNIPAMNTRRQFSVSARGMSTSMQKLSSGYKINTGKDDPAGLLISEQLRSQLKGIERATQNSEEAMNVINIAEGALNEMNNILKTMKTLATHSANSGVTTSDQVAADQVEMDSAIQTMDRIAQTTEFSSEKLLNGNKEIDFTTSTTVKGTQQNSLINERESSFSQIFKRDDYSVSVSYTGAAGTISRLTDMGSSVDFAKQATKAYLEVDTGTCLAAAGAKPQVVNGKFTQSQVFTLTGNQGSRQFTFAKGESVSAMVSAIHSAASSTGVDAALIFNSDQKVNSLGIETPAVADTGLSTDAMFTGNAAVVFGNKIDPATGGTTSGITSLDMSALQITDAATGDVTGSKIQWGLNTDGQGNIYVKFISDTQVELYKDSSMSAESLVGTANGVAATTTPAVAGTTWTVQESNNSGLNGMEFTVATDRGKDGTLADLGFVTISTGGLKGDCASTTQLVYDEATDTYSDEPVADISWSGNVAGTSFDAATGALTPSTTTVFDASKTVLTGIELGTNTSADGSLYFKSIMDDDGNIQVFAYKDKEMTSASLVAKSELVNYAAVQAGGVILNEVRNSDGTAGTGLNIALGFNNLNIDPASEGTTNTYEGYLTFTNLGCRIFSTEYGDEAYIKVTQDDGAIFTSYDNPGNSERTLIDSGEKGTTKLIYGQDATVTVNGKEVKTNGLELKVATQDIQADFTFNGGKVGSTTLAQVGYGTGSLFTKAGALNLGKNDDDAYAGTVFEGLSGTLCNAGHNTTDTIGDFQGGMQLQLGEDSGDQARTVVSIISMTSENLGRLTVGGYWDTSNPSVYTEKTLTLKDCMGGGYAALSDNPTLTMQIVDKAIEDVATQRAVLGAIQANLLQTNINNLEVQLENVTATEAGIRDTDMAEEMSEYTKNQVLQSAAMSMLSQANSQSQQVLQLLQ